MSNSLFDPKMYKHVKSDKDKTTLQHKRGHTITVAHNALSPKMRGALEALSKIGSENQTESQKQESQDANQYGKVIQKAHGGKIDPKFAEVHEKQTAAAKKLYPEPSAEEKSKQAHRHKTQDQFMKNTAGRPMKIEYADGGEVDPPVVMAGQSDPGKAPYKPDPTTKQRERDAGKANTHGTDIPSFDTMVDRVKNAWSEGGRVKMAEGGEANYAYDAGLPCLNPHCKSHGRPHPNCRCYSSGEHFAGGGEVSKLRYCAHGMPHDASCEYAHGGGVSEQGRDIRHGNKQIDPKEVELSKHFAREEAKGRAQHERTVKPNIKGLAMGGALSKFTSMLAEGGKIESCPTCGSSQRQYAEGSDEPIVPYGMDKSDYSNVKPPKDEAQTEKELDRYEAQNPSRLEQENNDRMPAREMSPVLQPGMTGYNETPRPIEDTEEPPTDGTERNRMPAMGSTSPSPIDQGDDHYGHPNDTAETQPNQPPVNMVGPAPQLPMSPPEQLAAAHIAENKKWQQDLANGHITPKTYGDLMYHNRDGSEKSTLGKIGSIFGLILSGFGAGLAHQQNMGLQMMDNAIKNDLDAQTKSKDNAVNYYRVNQQRLLNDANVKNVLASAEHTDAEKKALLQATDMKAYTQAYMQMGSTALQDQINKVKTMPEGPEKQKAAQLALMMSEVVDKNAAKAAAMGAAGVNALSMYGVDPSQTGGMNAEQKFQNDMQARENSGDKAGADSLRERHIPGVPGFASAPVPEHMREKFRDMNILDSKVKDVIDFAQQHRGSIDPRVLSQARQKAEELTSFYNKSVDSLGMTKGRLGWLEEQIKKNPTSLIQQLMGNNATLREIRDSNSMRSNQLKKDLGFPVNTQPQGSQQPQYKVDKDGVKWQRGPNGEAIRVK